MTDPTPPTLRFRFRITAEVAPPIAIERRDEEVLEFIPIIGGTVEGDVLGTLIPGGGDWCLTRADGVYAVEARYLFRTLDSEVVDVVNVGYLRHVDGESGGVETMGYFESAPRFRTTARHLQWLTRSVFVGRATIGAGATMIDVFEVC